VPALVDLAVMRDSMAEGGVNSQKINPLAPDDLAIDHSVMVDRFTTASALEQNDTMKMQRHAFQHWRAGAIAADPARFSQPVSMLIHKEGITANA
jgi:aconitate hydratase